MKPLYFNECFGWLHEPAGDPAGMGVVLCNPLGNEAICTHREWMELAEMLGTAGFPTLRFDYFDSGDSADKPSSLDNWVAATISAAQCLKQTTGVKRITLIGLRLGSAIAALAAQRIDGVDALAMLAPVINGRQLAREWRAAAGASHLAEFDPPPSDPNVALNVTGFLWKPSLLREIEAIDLLQQTEPCRTVLLVNRASNRPIKQYAAKLAEWGCDITEVGFPGYDAFMNEPLFQATPEMAFENVVDWVRRVYDMTAVPSGAAPRATEPVAIRNTLETMAWQETPLTFGRDNHLFGVLAEPPAGDGKRDIAVMMLHTGTSHHIGNGRILVDCARSLAANGIPSLRMDVAGIGDSPPWPEDPANPLYGPYNLSDATSALDALEARGYTRVLTIGICAGAYLALEAAIEDPRVTAVGAFNLQSFRWIQGSSLEIAIRKNKRSLRSYLQSTRNPATWRRVLKGEGDLPGIAAVLMKRVAAKFWRRMRDLRPPTPGSRIHSVRQQIQALNKRGVRGWFVWSDDDPGLESLFEYFGPRGKHLKQAGMNIVMLRHTDHNFNDRKARQKFLRLIVDYAERAAR